MLPNTSSLTERLQEMQTSWMEGLGDAEKEVVGERRGGGICREIHGKTRDQTCLHTTASDSEVTCKLMRDTSRYTLAVMATVAGELLSVLLDVHARITPRTPSITAPPRVDASNSGGQRSMSGKPRPRRFKKKRKQNDDASPAHWIIFGRSMWGEGKTQIPHNPLPRSCESESLWKHLLWPHTVTHDGPLTQRNGSGISEH